MFVTSRMIQALEKMDNNDDHEYSLHGDYLYNDDMYLIINITIQVQFFLKIKEKYYTN